MTIGENIKKARKAAGLTQKELGDKLGITQAAVAMFENDKTNIKYSTLNKFVTALNVSISDLIDNVIFDESQRLAPLEPLNDAEHALKLLLNNSGINLNKVGGSYALINEDGVVRISENDLQELIASSSESCAVLAERLIRKKFKESHSPNIIIEYPDGNK